jgi:hypothetical protein
MLQSGRFVADACYFQGEWVPSFVPAKWLMDPSLPEGYDCDVINAEILVDKARVNDQGELILPGGISYRYLVLNQGGRWQNPPGSIFNKPDEGPLIREWPDIASGKPLAISPATMRRILELVKGGLTLVGPAPDRAIGLRGFPASDRELKSLTDSLWGADPGPSGVRNMGRGRVIWGKTLHEILKDDGLLPDLAYIEDEETTVLPLPVETSSRMPDPCGFDWIHRQAEGVDYYYVANLRNTEAGAEFIFRQQDQQPELWDPFNGETRDLMEYTITGDGRIALPLRFAPRQSYFIVFRKPLKTKPDQPIPNFPDTEEMLPLSGEWSLAFDPDLGGPADTVFEQLSDWSSSKDERIRFYSGKARYIKAFQLKRSMFNRKSNARILLDLGRVEVMARVYLNGQDLGILWTPPWQVDISSALKPGKNRLEIEVVNLWRNRMIGDRERPENERITRTNVEVKPEEEVFPSGLIGPVILKEQTNNPAHPTSF